MRWLRERVFGTQLKEHQKAVSTLDKGNSALAEHVCYTKHKIAWENSKVITTNNHYGQRLCLEAWHINMSNHALNRDDSAYLPEEYMHLIGRWHHPLGYLRSHDCNFRSPLMKTVDWSVEMLGLDYNSTGLCNNLFKPE
jgi:hypothetical protein